MKVVTPEISWHERDPVYSVDFQPGLWPVQRIASGGVDKIVRIWQMTLDSEGKAQVDFLSNLRRHTATVNVVRFSRNGELLATAGDDSTIILWKLNDVPAPSNNIFAEDDVEDDKETWVCHKTLRGHLGDVVDLSWSKDNSYLISGSVDNCAIIWDVAKGVKYALFKEHKSYVQGVAFDPLGTYVATLSADRSLRLYNFTTKSCVHNVSKMTLPPLAAPTPASTDASTNTLETKLKPFRIFHDDSLRSFFRRLEFSPDGQLLLAPAGCMELGDKIVNTSFVFARGAFSKPAVYLPSPEKTTTVVRANPQLFELRPSENASSQPKVIDGENEVDKTKPWEKAKSLFCLPYRIVFAVGTEESVLLYDTQQTMPVGLLKNIHYHQISDLSWSGDGRALIISSTDGFCTIATFEDNELGVPYKDSCADVNKANILSTAKNRSNEDTDSNKSPETTSTSLSSSSSAETSDEKTPKRSRKSKPMSHQDGTKPMSHQDGTKPMSNKNKHTSAVTDASGTQNADNVPAAESHQTELSEQVSSMEITESSSVEADSSKGVPKVTAVDGAKSEEKEQEAPKKKRIQITTLSLLSKK
ncbi:unnamed protein product [Candidula unifasciata]|uniref:CAF1B/HIR1 beta-propeller domain-containing protein n=1 Tax=Candidula unifasciata TaxID=100452 RepID=A0A8S3Z0Q5_9EUPU|nr:unnamed protein product [Candidula unifasciata]